MEIVREREEMQRLALRWQSEGLRIALVPTMGFLHEGHLSLVRLARERGDRVVLSLFVNPTQFGPNEDLDRYPRDFERDRALCEAEGVDVLFAPKVGDMYDADHTVYVVEESLAMGLCGGSRPVHFRGVLTVVAKLFNVCLPRVAVFGEKDAQQLRLIERMVRDLDFPVEMVRGATVREADGLAMSSRNKNLSAEARAQAVALSRALAGAREAWGAGEREVEGLRAVVLRRLAEAPLGELDYLEIVDDADLRPLSGRISGPVLVALAVKFPGARLIDNTTLGRE